MTDEDEIDEEEEEELESESSGGLAMKFEDGQLVFAKPYYMTNKEWAKVEHLFLTYVKIKDIISTNKNTEDMLSGIKKALDEQEEFVKNPIVKNNEEEQEEWVDLTVSSKDKLNAIGITSQKWNNASNEERNNMKFNAGIDKKI